MSVTTTRLLVLGAVGLFEPVNGYQIRRELMSWQVDAWASINPGSIYHALRSLAGQGLLIDHTIGDGGRDVVVYELAEAGRVVLEDAIVAGVSEVNIYDRHAFQAAFGLLPMLDDRRAEAALRARRDAVRRAIGDVMPPEDGRAYAPPHALRSLALWKQFAEVELHWLDGVLADIASGALSFEDTGRWAPPADDPGYQIVEDRERYRAALHRAPN